MYYAKDIDQKEIDILYHSLGSLYPIEIKKGVNPTKPNKNFNVLKKSNLDIKPGLIIDNTDKIRSINDNCYTLPVYLLGL